MLLLPSCMCRSSLRFVADAGRPTRYDPTGTGKIRRRFENELVRRFRRLRSDMKKALVDLDVLGLSPLSSIERRINSATFVRAYADSAGLRSVGDALPPRNAFAFSRPAEKVDSFMRWLKQQQREGILGVTEGTPMTTAAARSWQNLYIDSAYKKGMRDAYKKASFDAPMGGIGAAFNAPIHADRVGLIYTRAFNELDGITDAMSNQISRILASGIADGQHPNVIARELADRVDKIGITRARTLARTETISAHAEATLNSYEEAAVEGVELEAEITTAGDDDVCPICESYEGETYSIDEARGMIPLHPNCRCAFKPVVK